MGWREFDLVVMAAGCSALLIMLLLPMFRRYALARPNARSSHRIPTPQGGGAAVILAVAIALGADGALIEPQRSALIDALPLGAAIAVVTIVGAIDDIFPIAPMWRLAVQAVAVTLTVSTMPAELRAIPVVPIAIERVAEIVAGLWFVNLVNFMDGIDWMTVAEAVPSTISIFVFALFGAAPPLAGSVALALCGALLGFAPFNRPVAKLFLGVADSSITLLLRLARGERITEAHRTHFYQLAVVRGLSVMTVVRSVFAVNLVLAVLAALSIRMSSAAFDLLALAAGAALVTALLVMMWRGKP